MTDHDEGAGGGAPLVRADVADGIATITLDSPVNRNALSRQLVTELFARLEAAERDDGVKVVVIRSSGRVFCSGADLSEATSQGMEQGAREIVRLQRLIVTMPKPVVVGVGGAVFGEEGGLGPRDGARVSVDTAGSGGLGDGRRAVGPAGGSGAGDVGLAHGNASEKGLPALPSGRH